MVLSRCSHSLTKEHSSSRESTSKGLALVVDSRVHAWTIFLSGICQTRTRFLQSRLDDWEHAADIDLEIAYSVAFCSQWYFYISFLHFVESAVYFLPGGVFFPSCQPNESGSIAARECTRWHSVDWGLESSKPKAERLVRLWHTSQQREIITFQWFEGDDNCREDIYRMHLHQGFSHSWHLRFLNLALPQYQVIGRDLFLPFSFVHLWLTA